LNKQNLESNYSNRVIEKSLCSRLEI